MNAFMSALQTKSAEIKKTTVKATPTPTPKVEVELLPVVIAAPAPEPTPDTTWFTDMFDFSGEAFVAYQREVDKLCAYYRCEPADLAVIAVMHLGRLIGQH
jgi:site-specific recombinase